MKIPNNYVRICRHKVFVTNFSKYILHYIILPYLFGTSSTSDQFPPRENIILPIKSTLYSCFLILTMRFTLSCPHDTIKLLLVYCLEWKLHFHNDSKINACDQNIDICICISIYLYFQSCLLLEFVLPSPLFYPFYNSLPLMPVQPLNLTQTHQGNENQSLG